MSSTSPPNPGIQSHFTGNDGNGLQAYSYRGYPSQPYPRRDDLSEPLLTTSTPSFSFRAYPPVIFTGVGEFPAGFHEHSHPPLVTGTALTQNTPGNSGVQSGSQSSRVNLQLPPASTTTPVSQPAQMRYYHTDLAVLSAEQYNEGHYSRRSASKANLKPTATVVPVDNAPNPKKRGRKAVDEEQRDTAEEVKRTRGRPRLETKDQTPTERRRTQIRLAQRAYRNRKENAITDLQEKIDNLKEVNSEINNAYQDLFDYASKRGLLAQAPEFGQQLQRLQSLIKETQDKNSPKSDRDSPEERSDDAQDAQRTEDAAAISEEPVTTLPEDETTQLWGGITVSHESVAPEEIPSTMPDLNPTLSNPQPQQYEIVTAPNSDNASFGLNFLDNMNYGNPAYSGWAEHPWNRLTGPRTMSFNEWSFARRLHRHAVERAAALISMPNPPPAKVSRVFGFVMLFETMDEIRTRTLATLAKVRDEPLNYWEHPFHRLGGSGTHFSYRGDGPSSLSGSSNYESTGYAMGPFDEPTMRVRDTLLGVSQYINMSGWEGTWFDSGEVETYLAQNGIIIPTSADIHTIELQPDAFSDVHTHSQIQLMQTIPPNVPPGFSGNQSYNPGMSTDVSSGSGGTAFPTRIDPPLNSSASSSQNDPWAPTSVTSTLYGNMPTAGIGIPSFTGFDNMTVNPYTSTEPYAFPHQMPAATNTQIAPKRVVLDVNSFISDLINHATCLGRAPAFRPKDIATSFWNSVIKD
ncbi:uncharacterized protein F4822DRAFT_405660 [Hypoxylon trugodes]|uniref:uncharacterized protein n=1 Tax=Hypoxylon trugodes TaxID=326681 RepID=UPI00218F3116|nr:uncharacterized protein F4822DRAFT_405660 [Hypoxylon trugodes]KAI1387174.1 hypothetical protein F4822DRAFT_405660 [Hypoxylon trugodes]